MNSTSTLSTLCLAACFMAAGAVFTPAHADDTSSEWSNNSATLILPQVLQKLEAAGYRNVEKIKLKRGNYEVRTTGRDGERIKLYVNARTGDILGQRDARKGDDHTGGVMQKLIGNCNERRCRDDLVSTPADATPTKP